VNKVKDIRSCSPQTNARHRAPYPLHYLKVSHPRCVVKIQVREENPIFYSHKTQLNIKLSLLQHYNDMFRPKLSAIFRLYMKPI